MTTSVATSFRSQPLVAASTDTERFSLLERGLLFVGINEVMLQFDKYYMHQEQDAEFGAIAGFVVSVMGLALAALYWIWFSNVATRRSSVASGRIIWNPPMLIYLAAVGLSVFSAVSPFLSLCDLFLIVQGYALFFYLVNRTKHRDDVVFLVGSVATALLVQSLFSIGLAAIGPGSIGRMFSIGPVTFMIWPDGRTACTMRSPVLAGSTMAMLWLPTVALALCKDISKFWRYVAAIATITGVLGILFTQTRGAVLTVIFGSGIIFLGLFWRQWLPKWVIPMTIVVGVLSVYPLMKLIDNRITQGDHGSAESRIHLTEIAFQAIRERPIAGYGAGNCHIAGRQFANQAQYRSLWYYTIHCKYLVVWLETGLLGLVSYLAILFTSLRYAWIAWRARDPLLSTLSIALMASLLGTMVHMFVDIFNSRTQTHVLWLIFGISAAIWKLSQEDALVQQRRESDALH